MHIYRQVSRTGLPVQAAGFIEALEPRLLLAAAAPSPPPDGLTIIGDHPQAVTAFAWADVDRDTVTPLLTGKGYVELYFETGVLSKIVLNGTTPATMFSLRVRQFKAAGQTPGDGLIGMGEVADDGTSSLNTLDLSAADLSGTIQMAGTLKTLKLATYSGPGVSLGGAPADKHSVTARSVDSAATFTFGGQIASLAVTSWAGGLVTALGIGTLSVTGGDFGADLDIGAGGIGAINVRGGNLTGTVTTDGAIGNITVTGVASFDAGASSGLVNGGAIRCPLIAAGALKGKSIGNITTSGGGLESVQIRVTGSIGNLNVKSLKYKAEILEEPVLDKYGEPKIDIDGNVVVRKVTLYDYASGGVDVDLDTPAKLGNVVISGGTLSGTLDALGIGTLSVTGGDFGADLDIGARGIGTINVRGGNLTGTVTTEGAIGNITVTGVASFDAGASSGLVSGGAILCPLIAAGAVNGKSIGNITTSGGGLESVQIRASGSIGNLSVKSLKYKAEILEEPVLDQYGEPRIDINGNMVVRKVTVYDYAWGGVSVDLDTPAKLGNVAISGGGLEGTLHAGAGMGNIMLEAILRKRAGTEQGIPYASAAGDIIGGDLSAQLTAEPGEKAIGIASITVVGGSFTGSATVLGKIGGITTKCYGLINEQSQTATLVGGNFTGGPSIQASSIGNISVRGELCATIIATSTIGSISVQAGSMASDLTAGDAIGNISVRTLNVDPRFQTWYAADEGCWYYTTWQGAGFGVWLQATIHLGQGPIEINRSAKIGTITGIGVDVTVSGEVPFDPSKVIIVSRRVQYLESCDWSGDGARPTADIKNWATMGGTVDRTGLCNSG